MTQGLGESDFDDTSSRRYTEGHAASRHLSLHANSSLPSSASGVEMCKTCRRNYPKTSVGSQPLDDLTK
ncbi:MAG: hypothetical protein AAGE92_18215, partial [Cyanobacteria bacterium P01_G01_bin.4]